MVVDWKQPPAGSGEPLTMSEKLGLLVEAISAPEILLPGVIMLLVATIWLARTAVAAAYSARRRSRRTANDVFT